MKKYKYPKSDKIFVLKSFENGIYRFVCGHWCTDSVFIDLIDIKTGLAGWENPQLKLF